MQGTLIDKQGDEIVLEESFPLCDHSYTCIGRIELQGEEAGVSFHEK